MYPGETLESFLERFPAGTYSFTGDTKDGNRLESSAHLTHVIPAHPEVEVEIKEGNVSFSWQAVTDCFEDVPCQGVEIAEYSVKVELEEGGIFREDTFDDGGFTNGASRYLEGHYVPAAICHDGFCEVDLSSDFFIEGDVYGWQVFAIEKSGNSTYRESELTFVPEPSGFVMGWFALATLAWLRHAR